MTHSASDGGFEWIDFPGEFGELLQVVENAIQNNSNEEFLAQEITDDLFIVICDKLANAFL